MTVKEAIEALRRAGYEVESQEPVEAESEPVFVLYQVPPLGCALNSDELIKLAHRHGRWPPAFERSHTAGPTLRQPGCTCSAIAAAAGKHQEGCRFFAQPRS
jgi:hypothetical protein